MYYILLAISIHPRLHVGITDGRKIGNLCGILYVNNLYLLPPKIWGKWDTIGLILISLPQETPGDKAQLRCFKRESVYISFTIRSQNIGDTRTLNLGIQPTGRDCFPTVHTSGRENGRIRNAFLVMSILGRRERAYSNTRFQSDSTTTINIYIYIYIAMIVFWYSCSTERE